MKQNILPSPNDRIKVVTDEKTQFGRVKEVNQTERIIRVDWEHSLRAGAFHADRVDWYIVPDAP
jgi:hypothetical protein